MSWQETLVLDYFIDSSKNDSTNVKQFCRKVRSGPPIRELNFNSLSVQSIPKKRGNLM